MSRGPLRSSDKGSVEYWAKQIYGKKYEYLTDAQAERVQETLREFLLQWQEEMLKAIEGGGNV